MANVTHEEYNRLNTYTVDALLNHIEALRKENNELRKQLKELTNDNK